MESHELSTKGSTADVLANLEHYRDLLNQRANRILGLGVLGSASRVIPNFLIAIAKQIQIVREHYDSFIEIHAGVCRTTFELNVALRYVLSDERRLEDFLTMRVNDEASIFKGVARLTIIQVIARFSWTERRIWKNPCGSTGEPILRSLRLSKWQKRSTMQKSTRHFTAFTRSTFTLRLGW
ncbi:MAG TPA: hypothetical protein VLZ12_01815 [Verrucomicrobiae bacterium]|nr:hypothetical protein [Verrucomicrobiae bacterium]